MTIKRKILALTTATAVAAGSLVPIATTAQANGARTGHGAEYVEVGRRYNKRGFRNRGQFHNPHHYHPRAHRGYVYKKKKNRTGKYLAIGLGALMLGIIASQASRGHHNNYDDRYDY